MIPFLSLFRKDPLKAASEARQAAQEAYDVAAERRDRRLQHERLLTLARATAEELRLSVGRRAA